jgi:hypothetical protein
MLHKDYEKAVVFASEGRFSDELTKARREFIERTGDLFESDTAYERRIASFLEWYVLDRRISFAPLQTPLKLFIDDVRPRLTTPELTTLRQLTRTRLSIFEFMSSKNDVMRVKDLLCGEKIEVFERRQLTGLEAGDLMEARLVPVDDNLTWTDAVQVHPRPVRRLILKATKRFRQSESPEDGAGLVHRVTYFTNRCERYSHLKPKDIFAEL